ncbi:MAG: Gfo/Idh/MocA family oxidoreductase [Oscillospiraceae bacterium]|nr:Gfo/Idh/MocA family oxidoreductase [Oscillospiraceae bacterium]
MKRYVIAGASFRCYRLFVKRLREMFPEDIKLVGVFDPNRTRCKVFRDAVGEDMTIYDDFDAMLDEQRPDGVLVTTVDHVHHEYIVRAMEKGYDVICEKPVTNTFERCLAIRQAEKRTGRKVTVTFNCRFMPYFARIKELLMEGVIGKVHAINYEYCLDRTHGADYFKRWHRKMEFSQGMLLHKSTHHFDVVNWLLEDEPARVCALGTQSFYAKEEKSLGKRCTQCPGIDRCTSSGLQCGAMNKPLYYEAEGEDGYIRDTCCFLPDADIQDNLSVSVQYQKGALLTYSMNLFSTREGYSMTITGEKGVILANSWSNDTADMRRIVILREDASVENVELESIKEGHGGGDERLLRMIFGPTRPDPLGQCADSYAGVVSAMVGVAANRSIQEGCTVELSDYLEQLR